MTRDGSSNSEAAPLPLISSSADSGALSSEAGILRQVPECETLYMSVRSTRGLKGMYLHFSHSLKPDRAAAPGS